MTFPCSGVENIYDAIGENIAILIQWQSTFITAFVVGLVVEYRLTLLLVVILPLMALSTFIIGKVCVQ